MDSILTSIKKMLGVDADYTHFDTDVTIHINTALMALTQMGIGPSTGFFISDSSQTWGDFIGDRKDLESVKTYVYLRVRLLFDPPTVTTMFEAIERQVREFEWRLNIQATSTL